MEGLKLEFGDDGVRILTDERVKDLDADTQNILMSLGTMKGSDQIFPDRGTNLFLRGLQGRLVDEIVAGHEGNYAGADVIFFVSNNDPFDSTRERFRRILLTPVVFDGQHLEMNLELETTAGVRIGKSVTL